MYTYAEKKQEQHVCGVCIWISFESGINQQLLLQTITKEMRTQKRQPPESTKNKKRFDSIHRSTAGLAEERGHPGKSSCLWFFCCLRLYLIEGSLLHTLR
mmetsp:Transcript_52151/g.60234  ORF Transcript_52151/g.60234 Transcript_52151/m.60234 type:complete len:100 (-) Transcript_52151:56-355(-)